MKIKFLISFVFFLNFFESFCQDPSFSQFYNNSLYSNPAFAGCISGTRIVLSSRMQYTNVENNNLWNSFNTEKLSLDFNIGTRDGLLNGIGLMITSDQEGGFLTTTKLGIPISFVVVLKKKSKKSKQNLLLQVGGAASILFTSVDWSNMVFTDQLDPIYGNVNGTSFQTPQNNLKPKLDVDAGAVLNYNFSFNGKGDNNKLLVGYAAHHITQPNRSLKGFEYSTSNLPIKHTVFAQCFIVSKNNNDLGFEPLIVYESQAKMNTFLFGSSFKWKTYSIGIYNRSFNNADALIICLSTIVNTDNRGPKRKKSFIISYSYDITISGLSNRSGGSHEISLIADIDRSLLGYFNFKRKKIQGKDSAPCPQW